MMQLLLKCSPQIKAFLKLSSRVYPHRNKYSIKLSPLRPSTSSSTTTPYRITAMSMSETKFVPGLAIPHIPKIPVGGCIENNDGNNSYYFPVNRIYCVGKNYTDHVKEMGGNPREEAPCFFMKPSNAIVPCDRRICNNEEATIAKVGYPLGTNNLHYEVELVVAIGSTEGGTNEGVTNVSIEDASKIIYGYGVGIDLTRRDIQSHAKKNGLPWCTSKGFDASAPISNIYPITIPLVYEQLHLPLTKRRNIASVTNDDGLINCNEILQPDASTNLWLYVNGQLKQRGYPIREMIWSVPEIISQLSQLYTLRSGDIIFTGTPAGVSNIIPNDTVHAGMNVLGELEFVVQAP